MTITKSLILKFIYSIYFRMTMNISPKVTSEKVRSLGLIVLTLGIFHTFSRLDFNPILYLYLGGVAILCLILFNFLFVFRIYRIKYLSLIDAISLIVIFSSLLRIFTIFFPQDMTISSMYLFLGITAILVYYAKYCKE